MSWLPWNRQPAPLPTRLERLRKERERAERGVERAAEREAAAWAQLRGAQFDTATAAELRLKVIRDLDEAEASAAEQARKAAALQSVSAPAPGEPAP